MKKILIGIIILIPLLVILSLTIVSDIISTKAYVAVEKVVLNKNAHTLAGVEDTFRINAEVFPRFASDKNLKFYIRQNKSGEEDIVILDERFDGGGEVKAATVSDDGVVSVNTYCSFTVVCESTSSGIKDFCRIDVRQGGPEALTVVYPKTELSVGERMAAELLVNPADASVSEVLWSSSDNGVLMVDQNGIAQGVSEGTAIVTAEISDNDVKIKASVALEVKKGVFKTEVKYVSQSSLPLYELTDETEVSVLGGEIRDGILTLNENVVTLTCNGQSMTIKRIAAGAIGFLNADKLDGKKLFVKKASAVLKVVHLETGKEVSGVEIVSSDENVARIENGRVIAENPGEVVFTAEADGYVATIRFKVARPAVYFYLDASETVDERGIAQATVYGNKTFVGDELSADNVAHARRFSIAAPNGFLNDEFEWTTDDVETAWFDENEAGLLHYASDFDGIKEINITVTAKNPLYEGKKVERSYSFKVANAYNADNLKQFEYVVNTLAAPVCLQSDAILKPGDCSNGFRYRFRANVYGNGYMVADYSYTAGKNDDFILVQNSDVTISNLTVRRREAIAEFDETNMLGKGVTVKNDNPATVERYTGIRIEYCLFEYCRHELIFEGADGEVVGSIFRNAAKYGLYSRTVKHSGDGEFDKMCYNTIDLENSVFSNMNGPAIGVSSFNTATTDAPMEIDGKMYRMYSVLNLKGFVDFYNWKDLDNLDIVGEVVSNPSLNESVKKVIQQKVSEPQYADLRYVADNGKQYVCMAILMGGLLNPSTSVLMIDGEPADDLSLYESQRLLVVTESMFGLHPYSFFAYSFDEEQIGPFDELKIDKEYLRQLREGRTDNSADEN